MLELKNVRFAYEKGHEVISGVSFRTETGEKTGLIGANGAGKSTLLKLILGLLSGEGEIRLDGIPVEKKTLPQVRSKIGYVLQNSENQMFMPTVLEDMIFGPVNYGTDRETAVKRAEAVLEQLGISGLRDRYNHRISGGEKKMGAIAVILTMEPDTILMDEPTASLDPCNRRRMINLMKNLPQTLLITSHDLDMIYDTCSRVILMHEGRIAADGPANVILRDRELLERCRLELPLRFQRAIPG